MKFFIALILLFFVKTLQAAEILCIFPRAAFSHQTVYRAVTEKLLENGHKLTLMSTHPSDEERKHENVTLIDFSFSIEIFKQTLDELYKAKSTLQAFRRLIDREAELVDLQLKTEGVQKILEDSDAKFDLLLIEATGISPFHAFADHFNIPVVGINSADAFSAGHEIMGNVANPIAHPDRILPFEVSDTFRQRVISCVYNLIMKFLIIPGAAKKYESIMRKHFPNINKSYQELVSNVDLQLVNAHPALGFIRPILPNTIQLGFLHIKEPKEIPEELKEIMDRSKNGVIYMSFGTVVTSKLAEKNFHAFLETFSELPYDILWKHDGDVPDSVASNVHIRKWFPQSDLLAHPKVKLFITHGVSFE